MYDYGCLMLNITDTAITDVHKEVQKRILEDDIYDDGSGKYGREDHPHITILYGLYDYLNQDDIMRATTKLGKPFIEYEIIGTNIFQNPKYDVVKIDIISKDLKDLNSIISTFPNANSHPVYSPHITVAYVKPGRGSKYVKDFAAWFHLKSDSSEFLLTSSSGKKITFKLSIRQPINY